MGCQTDKQVRQNEAYQSLFSNTTPQNPVCELQKGRISIVISFSSLMHQVKDDSLFWTLYLHTTIILTKKQHRHPCVSESGCMTFILYLVLFYGSKCVLCLRWQQKCFISDVILWAYGREVVSPQLLVQSVEGVGWESVHSEWWKWCHSVMVCDAALYNARGGTRSQL